ncbi:DoxX family protein [Phaeobacter sp. C3_T13_0]|uniref:DoxX family protein n=1 Tax=Phaeobacter cretensis TaxID=3342641 RepID=UPI0039BD8390
MSQSKPMKYATYGAIALATFAFGGAGIAKLLGVEAVHAMMAAAGWPAIITYIIGALEVAGVVGLFVKPVRVWAALGLGATSFGAFLFHAIYTPIGEGVPALVLLAITAFIFMSFRKSSDAAGMA